MWCCKDQVFNSTDNADFSALALMPFVGVGTDCDAIALAENVVQNAMPIVVDFMRLFIVLPLLLQLIFTINTTISKNCNLNGNNYSQVPFMPVCIMLSNNYSLRLSSILSVNFGSKFRLLMNLAI